MSEVQPFDSMSTDDLIQQFNDECGIKFCAYCGVPLKFTREALIEFLETGAVTVECSSEKCGRTYLWGDF